MITNHATTSRREFLARSLGAAAGLSALSALPPSPLLAVNQSYASPSAVVHGGDEVAIIPPVAGG